MSDYISREAFVAEKRKQYCSDCDRRKGMKKGKYVFCYDIGEAPCRSCSIDDMLSEVEDFPADDVRPNVTGKFHLQYNGDGCWHCSECNYQARYPSNFCPNCGADMREES